MSRIFDKDMGCALFVHVGLIGPREAGDYDIVQVVGVWTCPGGCAMGCCDKDLGPRHRNFPCRFLPVVSGFPGRIRIRRCPVGTGMPAEMLACRKEWACPWDPGGGDWGGRGYSRRHRGLAVVVVVVAFVVFVVMGRIGRRSRT